MGCTLPHFSDVCGEAPYGANSKRWNGGVTIGIIRLINLLNSCTLYRSLSVAILDGSKLCRTRIKCFRTFFNTPSSNSCMKSTTMMGNRSRPSGARRSMKAFLEHGTPVANISKIKLVMVVLTRVGTREFSLSKVSTAEALIGRPK